MNNITVMIIILAIIASSIAKIVIEKRKGVKCVGCPYSKPNSSSCSCNNLK